jgi:hypothetical protein
VLNGSDGVANERMSNEESSFRTRFLKRRPAKYCCLIRNQAVWWATRVAVNIKASGRDVSHIRIQIQRLRIDKICIGDCCCFGGPIRRNKPSEAAGVVSRAEVIKPGFGVTFFAGELVRNLNPEDWGPA